MQIGYSNSIFSLHCYRCKNHFSTLKARLHNCMELMVFVLSHESWLIYDFIHSFSPHLIGGREINLFISWYLKAFINLYISFILPQERTISTWHVPFNIYIYIYIYIKSHLGWIFYFIFFSLSSGDEKMEEQKILRW